MVVIKSIYINYCGSLDLLSKLILYDVGINKKKQGLCRCVKYVRYAVFVIHYNKAVTIIAIWCYVGLKNNTLLKSRCVGY